MVSQFNPRHRLLLGPGPSMVPQSVLHAMGLPVLGHLDPLFVGLMEEVKEMLRAVFATTNPMTFPVSGTGSAGMEFCFVNLIEPGDEVVVGINGVFGGRMAEVAERCGATVVRVESEWGRIIEPEQIAKALHGRSPKLVAIVHAETSTGVLTPVKEIAQIAHNAGALMLIDAVTSLGGVPVQIDEWGIDAAYSGTQKCLSCPPGLAPVTFGSRAMEVATNRSTKVQSWYLDVNLLNGYWGNDRVYHHTAPISMNYGLHEALRLTLEEGLEARWKRHRENHLLLKSQLEEIGIAFTAQEGYQLPQLNAIAVPAGYDDAEIRRRLLNDFNIEIGAGLGLLKGKALRIGLMGESSSVENVDRVVGAITSIMNE